MFWRAETPTRGGGSREPRGVVGAVRTCGRGSALPRDACRRCLARKSARTRFAFGFETSPARLGGPARPCEGGAPLPPDVESKGRANTPAGCARSVGFAADLRRGSLCGVQRGVHARGCGARCTRRARQPCAAPVSVTGLEGKRESGPSSEKCNQPVMIIRRSGAGRAGDLG